ncbi:MAG: DUF4402 domain-containing protein [Bacteroidia bacterium]|nr:DUF4402 domain-containing protein [Bacteroidia bacterium]
MPPRPLAVYVNPALGLVFGQFTHGPSGGTIIISPSGSRSATGSVIPLNGESYSTAIFEIEANPGTIVSMVFGPDAILTGSNGGSMTLQIGGSYPSSPLVTNAVPPLRTLVYVGGTLLVGGPLANPPGSYYGTFYVTFFQE